MGESVLDEAARAYPYAKSAIARWKTITSGASWKNFVEIKQHFNAVDSVGKCVVFDIKHDDFRLIAIVDYARSLVVVKAFLKHADYDREGGKMTAAALDYGALLAETQPEVVHNDQLYKDLLDRLSKLLVKSSLSEAEEKVVELLTYLIRSYEAERYKGLEKTRGIEVVKYLMELHGLKQKDLVPAIFETESVASETLNSTRDLTLKHIKRLSERFNLSADTFID